MRRALRLCVGAFLGLAAWGILSWAPDLCLFTDAWHAAGLTRAVGLALAGASGSLSLAAYVGVLTGAAVALSGGVLAIARYRSR